jgi:alpha-D-ribose 1-methylphosphonate 5-triphosphate synthase subunit PhnL
MGQTPMLRVVGLHKRFTLHHQGGVQLAVLHDVTLTVHQGECLVLQGPSGIGKSTLLRSMYLNYQPQQGAIWVRHADEWLDLCQASPQRILQVRTHTMGYVSQFLRVIPRVSALDVVSEPLCLAGVPVAEAHERAGAFLSRLHIPKRLWPLPPATFSGGEQQRVNLARGLIVPYPIVLLDEPTAALEAANRDVVIALMHEALQRGAALVGIFHDPVVQQAVGSRLFNLAAPEAH